MRRNLPDKLKFDCGSNDTEWAPGNNDSQKAGARIDRGGTPPDKLEFDWE